MDGRRVLHVGCVGTMRGEHVDATMHAWLVGRAAKVHGIDVNKAGIERMREGGYDVEWADAGTYASGDRYDAVLVLSVLQFTPSPLAIVENLARSLRPGGTLVVSVPNAYSFLNSARAIASSRPRKIQATGQSDVGEVSLFSPFTLRNLLAAAGLEGATVTACRAKPVWGGNGARERVHHLANGLPGLIIPRMQSTLVAHARRAGGP